LTTAKQDPRQRIEAMLARARRRPGGAGVILALERGDGAWRHVSGDLDRPYFIASATKLYTSTLLARLRERGAVDWDAPAATYLPDIDLRGLHVIGGVDRSAAITVRQLLAHTSSLPDYFEGRRRDGASTFARALASDQTWTVADVVEQSRRWQRAHFAPGTPGKARYSDTNYQLLGAIIEQVLGAPFAEAVRAEIAEGLGLRATWCFTPETRARYDEVAPILRGREPLRIPGVMASVGADGGIVSTMRDSLRFLRAFFGAELFARPILDEMQAEWRRIFFPLTYGTGVMRFVVPRVFSPFRRYPAVVGHSGASGALMFWCPEWDTFVVGTTNQIADRGASFRLMLGALAHAESVQGSP
jgi:D-alanyl-D-alanine carboxypeptidase